MSTWAEVLKIGQKNQKRLTTTASNNYIMDSPVALNFVFLNLN